MFEVSPALYVGMNDAARLSDVRQISESGVPDSVLTKTCYHFSCLMSPLLREGARAESLGVL